MRQFLILFSILVAIFLLWPTEILSPLKILVVFFHEASHALMCIVTGGQVDELTINPREGGHVICRGGNRFMALNAGYLGSLVWGMALYLLAAKSKYDQAIMFFLGVVIFSLTVLFVKTDDSFALGFGIATGCAMIISGAKAPLFINDIILRVVGLTSMLYAPLDIYDDTIARADSVVSDASMLANEFGGTTILWGTIWLSLSVVLLLATLKISLKFAPDTEAI